MNKSPRPLVTIRTAINAMKHPVSFLGLLAALCLTGPATGLSKDKHDKHDKHCDSNKKSNYYCAPNYNYSNNRYCPPVAAYRGYYPYAYSSPYYSSYYARPALSLAFTTTTSPTYYRSSSGDYADDLAVDVQRALRRRGYYRGEIDGDIGPGTRAAIREYQYSHRLEVTGRIDRSLLRSLGLS
jgi:His-Xaa-Ser repeat protein HxsA